MFNCEQRLRERIRTELGKANGVTGGAEELQHWLPVRPSGT
jgi:hypothetical protein